MPLSWTTRTRTYDCAERTRIFGVVNVTPDSFSDGGHFLDPDRAVAHGCVLAEEGADVLDVGGESTRPGSEPVSAEEERGRVAPVIWELRRRLPHIGISIDTTKASVAAAALEAGADILNDVTAGVGDPELLPLAASAGAGLVLMHMRGTPRTMQRNPEYEDVAREVHAFLQARLLAAREVGIDAEHLLLDPGIGFGKTLEHNLALIARLPDFRDLGRPLLLGVSRKRWIGDLTHRPVHERLAGSLAGAAACVERGAHWLRVHDVRETRDLLRVLEAIPR